MYASVSFLCLKKKVEVRHKVYTNSRETSRGNFFSFYFISGWISNGWCGPSYRDAPYCIQSGDQWQHSTIYIFFNSFSHWLKSKKKWMLKFMKQTILPQSIFITLNGMTWHGTARVCVPIYWTAIQNMVCIINMICPMRMNE